MSRVVAHVEDQIGLVCLVEDENGNAEWALKRYRIKRIEQRSNSRRVYARGFYPIDEEDLLHTTEMMRDNENLILHNLPFVLTKALRERCKAWVANENKKQSEITESEDLNGAREENRGNEEDNDEENLGKNNENDKQSE